MTWTLSRSDGDEPQILGVFASLDQACAYLDHQVAEEAAGWGPDRSTATELVAYAVAQESPEQRQDRLRRVVADRAWLLRCGQCGAEWTADAEAIRASDAWLSCPVCHRPGAGLGTDASTEPTGDDAPPGRPAESSSLTVHWRSWLRDSRK